MRKFSRKLLTLAGCLGLFACGLVISLVGVSLEFFAARLGTGVTEVGGSFFFAIGLSAFVMLFAAGPLIDRFGKKPVLVAGCLLAGVSMPLLLSVETLGRAIAVMFILGAGLGSLSGAINTLVNDDLYPENPGGPLNLVNLFFGIGAVVLPFTASRLIVSHGLTALILGIGLWCLVPASLFASAGFPPPREGSRFRLAESGRALADPLVLMIAVGLFLYVGLEASLGTWSRPAMIENWGIGPPQDQLVLTGYWGSIMLGRALSGTVLRKVPESTTVLWASAAACLGLAVFSFAPTFETACAALWFSGLSFAPIFPSSLGTTGSAFKHYTGTIFSVVIAGGVLGQTVITPLIGRVARDSSFNCGMVLALAICCLLTALQFAVNVEVRRRLARGPRGKPDSK